MTTSRARSMWTWPVAIGVLTLVGLLAALMADGPWDALSWAALGVPVACAAWYGLRRARASSATQGRT